MNNSFLEMLQKGTISTIESEPVDKDENPTTARVLPCTADSLVTLPLTIQWWLRGEMGNLQVGDEVVYAMFEDGSGTILARMDGDWDGHIHGDLKVLKGSVEMTEGDLTLDSGSATLTAGDLTMTEGNFTITGNTSQTGSQSISGDVTAEGNVTATGDVEAANVSTEGKVSAGTVEATGALKAASAEVSGAVKAGSVEATGTVKGSDVSAGSVSLSSHTHSTSDGTSGPPQ